MICLFCGSHKARNTVYGHRAGCPFYFREIEKRIDGCHPRERRTGLALMRLRRRS